MGMEGSGGQYDQAGGAGQQPPAPPPHVPNYLVPSILVTVLCCLPLGIVAIVFAAQVNGKLQAGDFDGAVEASSKAKLFCIIGAAIGLVAGVLFAILQVLAVAGAAAAQ